jgi:hypothetical protein
LYVEPTWVLRFKVKLLGSLRWKYDVDTYVEDTGQRANEQGFSVSLSEGQTTTGNVYPLNQVKLWGGDFGSNVKVVVGPHVTQIYFSVIDVPSSEELETVLDNLDKIESILNEVVVFTPDETVRFSVKTRRPVMSISMLKTTKMLNGGFNDTIQKINELATKEFSKVIISLVQGKIASLTKLNSIISMLIRVQRETIRLAKEQGNENAEKYERELDKNILWSNRFNAEITLAKSQDEIRKIIEKYSSKLFGIPD